MTKHASTLGCFSCGADDREPWLVGGGVGGVMSVRGGRSGGRGGDGGGGCRSCLNHLQHSRQVIRVLPCSCCNAPDRVSCFLQPRLATLRNMAERGYNVSKHRTTWLRRAITKCSKFACVSPQYTTTWQQRCAT